MKPIGYLNGWIETPQCWRTYLLRPIHIDRTEKWWSVRCFGFFVFFARNCP
jgi:hypothetical protein